MSEMVGRVALAITRAFANENTKVFLRQQHTVRADLIARAAIEAMREPNEDMIAVHDNGFTHGTNKTTRAWCWRAMIDAALLATTD